MPISACITRELTALLENFFASPEAFGKSNLGNHSKFPLYLKTKWFKWKVPLEHTLRVSRSETDLPRHVHWSWGHCWVPPWHPCSPACPLSLLDLMHTTPPADREYGGCADQLFIPREFSAQGKSVLTCRSCPSLFTDAYQVHLRSERTCS